MNEAVAKSKKKIGYADVLVSFLVIGIIGLIIIPLPATILDFLIIVNLTIAIHPVYQNSF